MTLSEFLASYADRPFEWGVDDCSLFVADWWRERHGEDPAAHLRGTYHDEASCHRLVFWSGGLLRLVSAIARKAGALRVGAPRDGDVAVLKVGRKRVCAIRSSGFWAIRNEQVAFIREAVVLRVWRV